MKLFGKTVFDKKVIEPLYDFAQFGLLSADGQSGYDYAQPVVAYAVQAGETAPGVKAKESKKKNEPERTPKEIYELKTLNQPAFAINCGDAYIDEQLDILREKLVLLEKPRKQKAPKHALLYEAGPVMYGRQECESMIDRLNYRRRYAEFEQDFSEWAYTTSDAIRALMTAQKHLTVDKVLNQVPDLPKEAVHEIKKYNALVSDLAGKKPVYYLISEKKKQGEVGRRRDPILLAQSPFGFFWQILGAWDKEVVFLEEL